MHRFALSTSLFGLCAGCVVHTESPRTASAPASAPVAAPGAAPEPSSDPCVVSSAEVDAPEPRCLVAYDARAAPPPDALAIRVVESPATVRSGEQVSLTLELQNVLGRRVVVPLQDDCLAWDTQASSETASTFESQCGALCGHEPEMLQLELEPGGVLRKRVQLTATVTRIAGDSCTREDLGPLPPGQYTLRVVLPWPSRTFEAPITVTR